MNAYKKFGKNLNKLRRRFFPHKAKKFTNSFPEYRKFNIGDYTYGNPIIHDHNESLTIGKFCSIGPNVTIMLGGNHRVDWATLYPFSSVFYDIPHIPGHPNSKGPIVIGNDVWLCTNCLILSGVTIGDGAVVAAGAVVTKNVEPFTIVAGNPAKPVKKRFDDETIRKLQKIDWWNWDIAKIKSMVPDLMSGDISAFIAKYGK